MTSSPLSPVSIVDRMAQALPTHEKDDTTSDLSSSLDAIALFTHACMAGLDFKLHGFHEDDKICMCPVNLPSPACVLANKPPPIQQPNASASPPVSHRSGTRASAPTALSTPMSNPP